MAERKFTDAEVDEILTLSREVIESMQDRSTTICVAALTDALSLLIGSYPPRQRQAAHMTMIIRSTALIDATAEAIEMRRKASMH